MTSANVMTKQGKLKKLTPEEMIRDGIYSVSRATGDCDAPPCEGAYFAEFRWVDKRTVDDPKKMPANSGTNGDWYEIGTRHRVENGEICRDMEWERGWVVEIKSMMDFIRDNGPCVLSIENGFIDVMIYDDYIE